MLNKYAVIEESWGRTRTSLLLACDETEGRDVPWGPLLLREALMNQKICFVSWDWSNSSGKKWSGVHFWRKNSMIKSFSIDEIQDSARKEEFPSSQHSSRPCNWMATLINQLHKSNQINVLNSNSNLFATYIFKLYFLNLKGLCNVHM